MRSCYQRQAIIVIERLRNVLSKRIPSSSWTYAPPTPIVRVAPQQIAHGPFMRNFLYPVQRPNVVQRIDARRQSAVQAEDLIIDEGGKGKEVEQIGKGFPDIGIAILAQALVVEAVDLCDLARFMVAAEDGDALGVADFESDEEGDGLDGVVASVDVVTWIRIVSWNTMTTLLREVYPWRGSWCLDSARRCGTAPSGRGIGRGYPRTPSQDISKNRV